MIKYKFIHLVIVHAYMLFEFDSLWKETFNSDCQQFHQYQQNEQLPRIVHATQDWVNRYEISVSQMTTDIFHLS